jgi:aspartyl-tRNA(Asn)/glutamyl-tRNA(Gln) amidotransferase subunit B
MQEGSLRCDANVNLHIENGTTAATPIVEIKNLNTFRGVEAAIEYETQRQLQEFKTTGRKLGDPGVEKETRGWDADRGITFAQRGKEEASDYRYFPDPDLLPVRVSEEWINEIRAGLSEAPARRRDRFQNDLGLSAYDAGVIVNQGPPLADYFEEVARLCGDAKQAANWVTQDVLRELKDRRIEIEEFPITSAILGTLLQRIASGVITVKGGREVFALLLMEASDGGQIHEARVDALIDEKGLRAVSDSGALASAVEQAIAKNPKAIEDLRAGKQQAIGAIIGMVMKQVKGADAKAVRELILQRIQG